MRHRIVAMVALAAVIVFGATGAASASTSGVVVSQVYGGGNSGAPFSNDFIEVFNAGSAPVDVSGWSVQYASATGTGNFAATSISGTIQPGGHLLVQEAAGTTPSPPLPPADATGGLNLSGTNGKVILADQAAALACNGSTTPCSAEQLGQIVDLVGYGSATFFEGTGPAPALSNTTTALRNDGGCRDTDDNAADFTAGDPAPHNLASPATPCGGTPPDSVTISPANGATAVPVDADLTLTFSRPVTLDPGAVALDCTTSGDVDVAVDGSGDAYTIDPAEDLELGETCTVTVDAALVHPVDAPTTNFGTGLTSTFTTVRAPVAIREIQGTAHRSPLEGESVRTSGVVTAAASNGFWIQDPRPDRDPATSEGVFVFTSTAPPAAAVVGNAVDVSGRVSEFRPGADGLTITELVSPTVTVTSTGNALPAAQVVGVGGRRPSSTIIEDDATDVEVDGTFDPLQDGIDFYESLEGMRVQLNNAVASGPTNDFDETSVLPSYGIGASVRSPRGGIIVREDDFNPERLIISGALASVPAADVGDRFSGATVGVLDYSFNNFMLKVTATPTLVKGPIKRETTPARSGAGKLAFATFNVENLDPGDPQSKFDRLAALIVTNLRAPDLLSLEEVQDDNGPTNTGTVTADATYAKLIAAITAAGGPAYSFRQIDPVDNQDGGEPGGNIRVAFLFRTDTGLSFVDRPGGTSTTPVAVNAGPELSVSPGRINPASTAFSSSRKPLAGEFLYGGQKLFVVANHWNSKGGDQPLYGRNQPPVQSSTVQRIQQAQIVHDFVADVLAADPDASVYVLGDLNDFQFSDALQTLVGTPPILEDLINRLPERERYSYVFDGNSQDLDHILASPAAAAAVKSIDAVHVNAEFADQASDHDPLVAVSCADTTPPDLGVTLSRTSLGPPTGRYVTVRATVSATDAIDPSPAVSFVSAVSSGAGDPADTTTNDVVRLGNTFYLRAEENASAPGDRTYTITYRAKDACGNTVTQEATATVGA